MSLEKKRFGAEDRAKNEKKWLGKLRELKLSSRREWLFISNS